MLNILSGLITNFKGSVLIDNTVFTNKDYSTNLYGYIIQQPFLFSGTIYENITFKKINKNSKSDKKFMKIFEVCGLNNLVHSYKEIFTKKLELDSPDISGGKNKEFQLLEFYTQIRKF